MFFASSEDLGAGDKYGWVIEAARYADREGFESVWVPERHFGKWGGLYPNPSVLHAALARETRRVRLRAGSVVLPLHDALRVVEEWSVVDNLSGGRWTCRLPGWNAADFVLALQRYADRHEELFAGIETVKRLWRGESLRRRAGDGQEVAVRTYPSPVQREAGVWVTAAGNPRTFERAGEIGANLLTHLLDQGVEELGRKIALYRQARARGGHDPDSGQVSVMLHTLVGAEVEQARAGARPSALFEDAHPRSTTWRAAAGGPRRRRACRGATSMSSSTSSTSASSPPVRCWAPRRAARG
jgi:natural product biosynthesis luciferase-like monooxygenase protein